MYDRTQCTPLELVRLERCFTTFDVTFAYVGLMLMLLLLRLRFRTSRVPRSDWRVPWYRRGRHVATFETSWDFELNGPHAYEQCAVVRRRMVGRRRNVRLIGPSFTLCIVSILFMSVRSQRSVCLSSHYEPKRTVETPLKQ